VGLGFLLIHEDFCGIEITHNETPESLGLLWMSDQLVAETGAVYRLLKLTKATLLCGSLHISGRGQQCSVGFPARVVPVMFKQMAQPL